LDVDPQPLGAQLASLYGSIFSIPEYFDLYDEPRRVCACELDKPRHLILFDDRGGTITILNRRVDIEITSLERVAQAIFRARPLAQRIHAETQVPPEPLSIPYRVLSTSADYVIPLPGTEQAYRSTLGSGTRRNLTKYRNRLTRSHPSFTLRPVAGPDISRELVHQTAAWNAARLHGKGVVSLYEGHPEKLARLWHLLQAHGLALCADVEGVPVAVELMLLVGDDAWLHTTGFDARYEEFRLGLLMAYLSAVESTARGCRRLHMLWGTPEYKERLGAQPVTGYQLCLYRFGALRAAGSAEDLADRLSRRAHAAMRLAKHRAGRILELS
jgi:hypothetical protein